MAHPSRRNISLGQPADGLFTPPAALMPGTPARAPRPGSRARLPGGVQSAGALGRSRSVPPGLYGDPPDDALARMLELPPRRVHRSDFNPVSTTDDLLLTAPQDPHLTPRPAPDGGGGASSGPPSFSRRCSAHEAPAALGGALASLGLASGLPLSRRPTTSGCSTGGAMRAPNVPGGVPRRPEDSSPWFTEMVIRQRRQAERSLIPPPSAPPSAIVHGMRSPVASAQRRISDARAQPWAPGGQSSVARGAAGAPSPPPTII
jgi:hypothetical protein